MNFFKRALIEAQERIDEREKEKQRQKSNAEFIERELKQIELKTKQINDRRKELAKHGLIL